MLPWTNLSDVRVSLPTYLYQYSRELRDEQIHDTDGRDCHEKDCHGRQAVETMKVSKRQETVML